MPKPNQGVFQFRELARAEIGDNLWVVISARSPDAKIVVATATVAQFDGRSKTMYMPNPLVLAGKDALGKAANALMDAFDKLEALTRQAVRTPEIPEGK